MVKVIKVGVTRYLTYGKVLNIEVKDQYGDKTGIDIWNKWIDTIEVSNIYEFRHLRVNGFPKNKPHWLKTTLVTNITNKTEEFKETFKDISRADAFITGEIESCFDAYCYRSCPKCLCKCDELYCKRCMRQVQKANPDFRFKIILKTSSFIDENEEEEKYHEITGFRRGILTLFEDILPSIKEDNMYDLQEIEDFLNTQLEGKFVRVDYNVNNDNRIIHELAFN